MEVVGEFNRYNEHQVVITDPGLANLRIGGSFSATDVGAFIQALRAFGVESIETRENTGRAVSMLIGSEEAAAPTQSE